jgi:outer membrane protein OmpA-like peptidoglycan-associated protein
MPSLRAVHVHLILSPAAGDQPRLNLASDAWRRRLMVALLRRTGADVVSVTEDEAIEPAAPGVPPASVVANLPDPTRRLPGKPRAHRAYRAKLDSSTWFRPNTAQFTVSTSRVLAALQPVISGWRRGLYSRVTVIGHCAHFGPAAGARLLSQQRAAKIARLLRLRGVSDVTAIGVGYSHPLPPTPTSASNRVVIVTAFPPKD